MLTREYLTRFLHYDPESGVFTRTVSTKGAKAGAIAGSVSTLGRDKPYVRIDVGGKTYYAHRLAWLFMTGAFPAQQVDHGDGDATNNRWENIKRSVDHRTNCMNRSLSSRNRSGHVGVTWEPRKKKWVATIGLNGKTQFLGLFVDKAEAARAARDARTASGFHVNHGQPRPY